MTARPLRSLLPLFLPYLVLSAVHLLLLVTGPSWSITATKALLMPLLALAVLLALRPRPGASGALLVAAIAASWAGDVLLTFPGPMWFVAGLLGFLVAHVLYLVLFVRLGRPSDAAAARRRPRLPVLAAYTAWYVGFLLLLGPHLGALFAPVAVYGLVLGAMAAVASTRGRLVAAGGALFVVSDSVLALGRFLPGYEFAAHDLAVMGTYLAAQGLIALGVVLMLRAAAPSAPAPDRPAPATAP
ncbi:lysoplasmalogenase [Agromyces sp. CFH 90414]|uniref:Lysoplasmalogenase n=1 Tax=Agromyces agglutinans TaxID=2662258 RepID=A0A6I2FFA0_9MICO|nr:lysoplasmalogenase [Agromyces agglutinans]MRG61390.1 lysoplasmalogenase [Agromyces agglutinans]